MEPFRSNDGDHGRLLESVTLFDLCQLHEYARESIVYQVHLDERRLQ
jgi:hypothetical protein